MSTSSPLKAAGLAKPTALFDLDGTLTDPAVGISRCIEAGLAAVDLRPDGDLLRYIGPPLVDSFADQGVPPERIGEAVAGYRERFVTHGMFENEMYSGIPEALAELRDRGWLLAVATSKPEVFATKIVQHFEIDGYFEHVVGATLDSALRHKTDIVAEAIRRVGSAGVCKVMVGDRLHDMIGGSANQLATIGVLWGYGDIAELIGADADRLASERPELPDLVAEFQDL